MVKISEKTKKELEEFEIESKQFQDLKNLEVKEKVNKTLDKIEKERGLDKDYIEQKIENERQFYQQLADEIDSPSYVSYFTDDDPNDLDKTPENAELGILKPEREIYIDDDEEDN